MITKHLSVIHIEHIGSTSVKRMIAKPIIDIMIGAKSYPPPLQIITTLEQLGYYNFGENDMKTDGCILQNGIYITLTFMLYDIKEYYGEIIYFSGNILKNMSM